MVKKGHMASKKGNKSGKNVGRPRSEKARRAIIDATHALLGEEGGGGLTIEAIARRAKVGKPTIYRWWPSLADIVLEALLHQAEKDIAIPESESLEESLREFLRTSMQVLREGSGDHLRYLMAQAQLDEEFRDRFQTNLTAKRRQVLKSLLVRAHNQGRITPGTNLDIVVDMIFGAMWYRLLTGHAPMDDGFADELTTSALAIVDQIPASQ